MQVFSFQLIRPHFRLRLRGAEVLKLLTLNRIKLLVCYNNRYITGKCQSNMCRCSNTSHFSPGEKLRKTGKLNENTYVGVLCRGNNNMLAIRKNFVSVRDTCVKELNIYSKCLYRYIWQKRVCCLRMLAGFCRES